MNPSYNLLHFTFVSRESAFRYGNTNKNTTAVASIYSINGYCHPSQQNIVQFVDMYFTILIRYMRVSKK